MPWRTASPGTRVRPEDPISLGSGGRRPRVEWNECMRTAGRMRSVSATLFEIATGVGSGAKGISRKAGSGRGKGVIALTSFLILIAAFVCVPALAGDRGNIPLVTASCSSPFFLSLQHCFHLVIWAAKHNRPKGHRRRAGTTGKGTSLWDNTIHWSRSRCFVILHGQE
jgi:fatty acid desaturase